MARMGTTVEVEINLRPAPLGIKPRYFWIEERLHDIEAAIERYVFARAAIPVEWIEERNGLIKELER